MGDGIDSERFEGSQDDEHRGPTMVEGERKMNPKLVVERFRRMLALDNVIDVRYR